jgi:hypothetical protein
MNTMRVEPERPDRVKICIRIIKEQILEAFMMCLLDENQKRGVYERMGSRSSEYVRGGPR